MKKVLLCVSALLLITSCNKVMQTTFWGLHLSKWYTIDEIITKIGTKGEYISAEPYQEGSLQKIISYENIKLYNMSWDYGRICVDGFDTCCLYDVEVAKLFKTKKEARDLLYSFKSKFSKRYLMKPEDYREGETEAFYYRDSEKPLEGATAVIYLTPTDEDLYPYLFAVHFYSLDRD